MATEEAGGEEGKVEPTAKGGGMKWVIIALVVLLLLGGGAFAYFKFLSGAGDEKTKAGGGKDATKEAIEESAMPGTMFPLESFIINLAGSKGKRFLKITVDLELDKPEVAEEIKARLPQVQDSILVLLSSKTFDEVYTVQGKFKLRDEIINRTNSFLKTGKVKNVYFTEFVIQ